MPLLNYFSYTPFCWFNIISSGILALSFVFVLTTFTSDKMMPDFSLLSFYSVFAKVKLYNFKSIAIASFSKVISGTYSSDNGMGIIYEIKLDPNDVMNTQRNVYQYPNTGEIVFNKLYANENIVTFTYDKTKNGYFDLSNSKAVFEEYKK